MTAFLAEALKSRSVQKCQTVRLRRLFAEKGFGFIEGERGDLFFHHSEVQGTSIEQLREGQAVQYEIGQAKKGPCAVSVRLVE